MRVRCLDCRGWATHKGRCAQHHRAYEAGRTVQSHRKRREVIARGSNAAARLRAAVRKAGEAQCANCGGFFLPSGVDIDHVVPLALGGEDVDGNVQPLCKGCHKTKTRKDFDHQRPPF
ncbi:HNH endonuclease signature motif containing protein [Kitasatospora sp. NPDC002227]|uniref:HNH endonuclease n=1 Tax=Kitasatospora sp. NPDC002227 TaxID=3154773 RepID=UPI00332EE84B